MIDLWWAVLALAVACPGTALADTPPPDIGAFKVNLAAPAGQTASMGFLRLPTSGSALGSPTLSGDAGASGRLEFRFDDGATVVALVFLAGPNPAWSQRVTDSATGRFIAEASLAAVPQFPMALALRWSPRTGVTVARGTESPLRIGPVGFAPRRLEIAVEGLRLAIDPFELEESRE